MKMCEEQEEYLYQDIKNIERRYQRRWNINMMGDTVGHITGIIKINHIGVKAMKELYTEKVEVMQKQ